MWIKTVTLNMMFPAGKMLSQTRLLRFIMVNSNRTSLKQQFRVFAKKWLLADFCNINVFYLDQRPLSHITRRVPGCSSRDLTEIWRKTLDAASEATVNRRPKKNHFMRILESISRRKWKDLFSPCQTTFSAITTFLKCSILDLWQGFAYVSA